MIRDRNISWNRKRVFLPFFNMLGVLADASIATGAPVISATGATTSGIASMKIHDAGDEIYTFWPIPSDLDISEPLRFRIWFTHSSTSADTPSWEVSYKGLGDGDVMNDAKTDPDEEVAFAATAVSTTAYALEVLDWEESVSDTKIDSTDHALLIVTECIGLGSASADEIEGYGLEIEYTVGACLDSNHRDITRDGPTAP
jgi:hypothetical protein